jgi:hypothetical protein
MKQLYKYTSNGLLFYFIADIPEELYNNVQSLADSFDSTGDMEKDFEILRDLMWQQLNVDITKIQISEIFRNYIKAKKWEPNSEAINRRYNYEKNT